MSAPASASSSAVPIDQPYQGQIFSQEEWGEMYPREEYLSKELVVKARVQKLGLHYLMGLNQSKDAIQKYMNALSAGLIISKLTALDSKHYRLTPLMIAVMRARLDVVKLFIESCDKANLKDMIEAEDVYGWRAIHHAVLTSQKIFLLLVANKAEVYHQTKAIGTVTQLRALISESTVNYSSQKVTLRLADGSRMLFSELTSSMLFQKTGLKQYRDDPLYTTDVFKKLWQQQPELDGNERTVVKLRTKPPALLVGSCSELIKIDHPPLELYADEDISEWSPIAEYSGVVVKSRVKLGLKDCYKEEAMKKTAYLASVFNAQDLGNVARFANCGWPNAALIGVSAYNGTERSVLLALEPQGIKRGVPIRWDYGILSVELSFGRQLILGRDEMRLHYLKGLKHVCKLTRYHLDKSTSLIWGLRLHYPLNNPVALLDLHFTGLVMAAEWEDSIFDFNNKDLYESWSQSTFGKSLSHCFRTQLIEVEKVLSMHPKIKQAVSSWVLSKIGQLTMMQIIKGLVMIKENLLTNQELLKNGFEGEYQNALDKFLFTYDWLNDDEAPMGEKQRAAVLLKINLSNTPYQIINTVIPAIKKEMKILNKDSEGYRISAFMLEGLNTYLEKCMKA